MEFRETKNQTTGEQSAAQAVGAFIWDLVKILVVSLIIIVPFRMFVAEPFVVSGTSMLPNYHDKDYLVIDRFSYRTGQPERGDVVVLKFPKDISQFFIKRVIGLPGETVTMQDGYVYITNTEHPEGWKLPEPYLPSQGQTLGSSKPVTLGSDEYFVLGDNRTGSSDSRYWGVLPREDIVGKAWIRVFPVSRFHTLEKPNYNE